MNSYIKVRTQVNGIHRWPHALGSVSYLENPHRHTFIIEVTYKVNHNDRDKEFIITKGQIDHQLKQIVMRNACEKTIASKIGPIPGILANGEYNFDTLSCEQIAQRLLESLPYKDDVVDISVSEDGEFFGIISRR